MKEKQLSWYRMDNTSVLYSALQTEHYSAIYRFSAVMTEKVDPEALQRAIDKVMPRFPGFRNRIKKGFFWYYFEKNDAPGPFLREDAADPCMPVRFGEDDGWLIRFFYYERRISVEIFHALSDGGGAMVFLRCLLAQYLRELGHEIPSGDGIPDINEKSCPEEWEDAYSRWCGRRARAQPLIKRAYENLGTPEKFYTFNVTMGFMEVSALKKRSRELGVSITEYLAGVLMYVLMEKQRREHPRRELPIALTIPVNLRPFFPSPTLRNFITTVQPWIDPSLGDYSLEDICQQVRHYMRFHCSKPEMQAAFTRNVKFQNNPLLRVIPCFLKDPVMSFSYRMRGIRPYSANFTNPGIFRVPAEMEPFIEHMEVIQGQATVHRPNFAAMSYGNIMEVAASGTMRESDTERDFFRFLIRDGIPVHIESNRRFSRGEGGEK